MSTRHGGRPCRCRGKGRCVEHGSDAQHIGRIRRVGFKLFRQRDDRGRASVVDVADLSIAGIPSSVRRALAIAMPDANISTRGPGAEDRLRRVEEHRGRHSRCQGHVDRREQHAVDQYRVGWLAVQRCATSPAMVELKQSSSIRSFTSASKSSIASQPLPWVKGTKRAPTSPHRSVIESCPIIRTSWPRSTRLRATPSVGT